MDSSEIVFSPCYLRKGKNELPLHDFEPLRFSGLERHELWPCVQFHSPYPAVDVFLLLHENNEKKCRLAYLSLIVNNV